MKRGSVIHTTVWIGRNVGDRKDGLMVDQSNDVPPDGGRVSRGGYASERGSAHSVDAELSNQGNRNDSVERKASLSGQGTNLDNVVTRVASSAHDKWREPRRIEGADQYEPRPKPTSDQSWIEAHDGKTTVDIANTPYSDLPSEWQKENKDSATVAVSGVARVLEEGGALDQDRIEEIAARVHAAWVERNGDWAPDELKLPYEQLPEAEKAKDRNFVLDAIRAYEDQAQ